MGFATPTSHGSSALLNPETSVLPSLLSVLSVSQAEPSLRNFNSLGHNQTLQRFQELEQTFLLLSRKYVKAQVVSRMPNRQLNLSGSEIAELTREITKKRNRLPLRTLFSRIPTLLPKLKPCLLASPISVARFLPADGQRFDLVIFDEASQVETHDAIGAIARGQQVVIVGDNKQMPPTNFFGRTAAADDDIVDVDCVDDLESILDEAIACSLPQQMLQWHYRSRHETLIAFSNDRYYASRLNIFPAASRRQPDLGVHWHPVPQGYYQPGDRVNEREAEALVEYLLAQLRRHRPGERSFGVITFSTPQQLLIETLLQEACQQDPDLEVWFDKQDLDYCFIKNLETVQGDERDEILFSICYAPQQNGKLSMSFGPLNRQGGERRLNVAVTRARCALHVFSTLQPEQIDLSRTNAIAVRHLREFLSYAQRQEQQAQRSLRRNDFDSDLPSQIYDVLVREGYAVDCKVGCADYRIDCAVVDPADPSRYRIGIECDGPVYAAAETVRDRDRLRQNVLEQLGWTLHRVWSVEWLLDRQAEEQRLLEAVRRACEPLSDGDAHSAAADPEPSLTNESQASQTPVISPIKAAASLEPPIPAAVSLEVNTAAEAITEPELGRPYVSAQLASVSDTFQDFYQDDAVPLITERLLALLAVEAPIMPREATQKVTQC